MAENSVNFIKKCEKIGITLSEKQISQKQNKQQKPPEKVS